MEKIKVLVASLSRDFGGVESIFLNLCRDIEKKITFDFLCWDKKVAKREEFLSTGAKIFTLERPGKNLWRYCKEINKIIKNYDVYHVNLTRFRFPLDIIMAKIAGLKIVIHTHSTKVYKSKSIKTNIIRILEHKLFKIFFILCSDMIISCNTESAKFFWGAKKVNILYNGIDTNKFKYSAEHRNEVRNQLGLSDDTILLGHVGRFSAEKNHKFLVEVIREISKYSDKYKLICIGSGDLYEQIINYAQKQGVSDKLIFTGVRSDINKLLSAMDIFLLPSHHEAYPLVLVEAQANGLPCIISKNVSKEIDITKKNYFVDINNINEWVNLLIENKKCVRYMLDEDKLYQLDVKNMEQILSRLYSSLFIKG